MKKRKFGYKLSRGEGARRALYKSLVESLVEHGEITTTYTKAKAVQPEVERLVKKAKMQTLASRRYLNSRLSNKRKVTDELFQRIAKAFEERIGNYTTIIQKGVRKGDGAQLATLKWSIKMPVNEIKKSDSKTDKKSTKKESALSKVKKAVSKK